MRGHVVDITAKLSSETATILAQWIGASNVIRNQKIRENEAAYRAFIDGIGEQPTIDQSASHIHKIDGFGFLKTVPPQVRRNAASLWYQDMQATLKGLRKAPRIRGKAKRRSVYLTKELFAIHRLDADHCVLRVRRSALRRDTHNFILHVRLPFHHTEAANAVRISRQGRRFWVSMAYRKVFDVPDEQAIRQRFKGLSESEAAGQIAGFDIGVARQVTDSNGTVYHLTPEEQAKLVRLEQRRIRYQRQYARRAKANDRKTGTTKRPRTGNEKAASRHLAQIEAKRSRIRTNASHRISRQIAASSPTIAAFEDINLQNLTRRPKAKQCPETGRWLRNNARAKAGLNKAVLNLNLGQIRDFAAYKLAERGKLMVKVPAPYSSQECAECEHTEKANRPDQSTFHCRKCGHKDNADTNAGRVIRKRGIKLVLSDTFASGAKTAKRTAPRKTKARDTASFGSGADVSLGNQQPAMMRPTEGSHVSA